MKIILGLCMVLVMLFAKSTTVEIKIEGMSCPLCTTAIKKSLEKVKGVSKAKVKLNTSIATVTYDNGVKHEVLLQAVKDVGYRGKIVKE